MADFIIDPSKHFGWAGPAAAKDAWDKIGHLFPTFAIKGSGPDDTVGKRFALYEIVRKVLNRDTRNYAQETGDCFVQGALIRLADGSACPIEEVGVGESVLSGAGNIQEVDSVIQKVYSGDLYQIAVTGRAPSPKCTADHQYQRPSGDWVAAALLKEGDYIRIASDYATTGIDAAKIVSITKTPATDIDVYCFSVPVDRSFILQDDGYVVHNCVSFGAKNAIEYLQAIAIALGNSDTAFHEIFPPYLYNIGRVLVGNGQMRGRQGSVGSWQAKAVELWGSLAADSDGCPKYSGALADQWGDEKLADTIYELGKTHLVRQTAPITNWDDLRRSIGNGYPATIASNQGFEMKARSDGFHYPSGEWGHQMCWTIIDDDPKCSYVGDLNSWGDVHGEVVDFKTGEKWPVGMLRIRREVAEHMMQSGECIAYSNWQGFPAQKLDWASVI